MAALVSALGHDLKSPLNAIIGFSEILQAELFGPLGTDRYRGYAKDIADSGRRLLWLINLVLDAAKAESTPVAPEATGAEALLVGLAARAEERGAPVEFRVSDPTLLLMTDERALRHLLELLLLVATGPGGPGAAPARIEADTAGTAGVVIRLSGEAAAADRLGAALHDQACLIAAFRRRLERAGTMIRFVASDGILRIEAPAAPLPAASRPVAAAVG
jgi:two-component system cell cycle sensor histidine kinase PleC